MKPAPIFFGVETGADSFLAIALLAPRLNLPVFEISCPRKKVG